MKKRERKILLFLLQHELVTIAEITQVVDASEKTIRVDLQKGSIEKLLQKYNLTLVKKRGRGVQIAGTKIDRLKLLKVLEHDQEEVNYVMHNHKEHYILLILLLNNQPVSITKLEHKLYLTRGIIYGCIRNIKLICKANNLTLINHDKEYTIDGPEKNYRNLIFETIIELYAASEIFLSSFMYDILNTLGFDSEPAKGLFTKVDQLITIMEQQFQVKLLSDSIEHLRLKLFISLQRYEQCHEIKIRKQIREQVYLLTEKKKISELQKACTKILYYPLSEAEIIFYVSQLSSLQTYYINVKKFVLPQAKAEINQINSLIKEGFETNLKQTLQLSDLHYLEKVLIQTYNALVFETKPLNLLEFQLKVNPIYFQQVKRIITSAIKKIKPELLKFSETIGLISQYFAIRYEPKLKATILLKGTYEEIKLISALFLQEPQGVEIIDIFPLVMDRYIKNETEIIITNTKIETADNCIIYFGSPLSKKSIVNINNEINEFKLNYHFKN